MDGSFEDGQAVAKKQSSFIAYLSEDVTESWADAVLVASCFLSGIIDSSVFNVWSCFVSMQTGNTIYAGLGVSGQPLSQPYRWAKSLTAILSFCLGTYVFSRVSRLLGPQRRSTMVLSWMTQAVFIFVPGALVSSGVVPHDAGEWLPHNAIVLVPLGMLSFQSAGQIVLSRILGYGEVPSIVLTSTYCDLMFDPHLLTAAVPDNSKRNRRVLSVVLMLLGAIAGGYLTREGSVANSLWIAGSIKVAIAGIMCFWKAQGTVRLE